MQQETRVWIYCRVLSYSAKSLLDYQEEVLTDFANQNGMHIIGTTKEVSDGLNFKSYDMQKLIYKVRNEHIDAILIYGPKRITVFDDLYEEFKMICDKHHIRIISFSNHFNYI